MVQNKSFIFKAIPNGSPKPGKDIVVEDRPIDLSSPPKGGIIAHNIYASFDPYQRGRMRPSNTKSYASAYKLNEPILNRTIAKVLKSDTPQFKEGDLVYDSEVTPVAEYFAGDADWVSTAKKLENPHGLDPKVYLGALGMPGLTAYSSFYDIGHPKKGETIFISAASGAVGQLVGQLAKREGLKVFGSVGVDKKLKYIIDELGFDGGFNYKEEKTADALKRLAPDGIDIYFDNVGGETLEAAIAAMKVFGRIIICGMISQYNLPPEDQYKVGNLTQFIGKRLSMRGFIVGDSIMGPRYTKEHQENVAKWIKDGSFKVLMDETKGIDNAPEGFVGMLNGENFGKAILTIDQL
jgi:NADPH-dependent curcumin reductase CurA